MKLGLVGCGLVALAVHLKNRSRIRGAQIVAFSEPDAKRRERAGNLARELTSYSRHEDLLLDPSIDGVIVSVPYEEHAAVAIAAFESGKCVYLEKPFTTTLEDARRVRAAWVKSGLVGAMGFNYRFNPQIARLVEAVRNGKVGQPVAIESTFSFAPHEGVDWSITRHGEFGALFDLGPHEIDLARFITGEEVNRGFARPRSLRANNDTLMLVLEMKSGVLSRSFLSTNCVEEHRIAVYGTEGKLTADLCRTPGLQFEGKKAVGNRLLRELAAAAGEAPGIVEKLRSPWNEPSFLRAVQAFVEAVQSKQEACPSFEDGYRNHLVLEAAQASMRSGRMEEVILE